MIIEDIEMMKTEGQKESTVKVILSKAQAKVLQGELEYLCTECDDHGVMSIFAHTIKSNLNLMIVVDPGIDDEDANN